MSYNLSVLPMTLLLMLSAPPLVHCNFEDVLGKERSDIIKCPANNISADLQIVPPVGQPWVKKGQHVLAGRNTLLYCCATGFSYFKWYKNGEQLSDENSYSLYAYNNETTREMLRWYSLNTVDCPPSPSSFQECVFTCEAYSIDEQYTVTQNITIYLVSGAPMVTTLPEFARAEAEECLLPGDDLNVYCNLYIDFMGFIDLGNIKVSFENGTILDSSFNGTLGPLIFEKKEYVRFNNISFYLTIKGVTDDFLNQTYTCHSLKYPEVSRSFHVPKCRPEVVQTIQNREESKLSVKLAIPLVAILLVGVLSAVLLIRFNVYANMWYKRHILQRLQSTHDGYKYDVYCIYKDVTHPTVFNSIRLLQNEFNLTLCLPERDFTIGASTPESITDSLTSSNKVVIFLSNNMLATEDKTNDWSDMSVSIALAFNKKVLMVLIEDIDMALVKSRKDIKAALKILDCVSCPSSDDNVLTKNFSNFCKKRVDEKLEV